MGVPLSFFYAYIIDFFDWIFYERKDDGWQAGLIFNSTNFNINIYASAPYKFYKKVNISSFGNYEHKL